MTPPIEQSKLAAKVDALEPRSRPEVKAEPSPQAEQIKEAVAENITKPKRPRSKNNKATAAKKNK